MRGAWEKFRLSTGLIAGLLVISPSYAADSSKTEASKSQIRARRAGRLAPKAEELIANKDWLGFRVFVRKNFSKISHPEEWIDLRALIFENADRVGYDLVYAWDKRPPGLYVNSGQFDINESRFNADNLMIGGHFEQAFSIYQKIAEELLRLRKSHRGISGQEIDLLYPYILHSMARALYGAGRYDESFIVLRWIPQTYPKFRQVQFEKMWAAFRGGRIDHALGAIASQSSTYFSRYLSPESYLVQTYLYKKLCREDDFKQVIEEMRQFKTDIESGKFTMQDWTNSDVETRVLMNLAKAEPSDDDDYVTHDERLRERERIRAILNKAFESQKLRTLDDVEKALAYVQLAVRAGPNQVLKPVEKLPSRSTLFKMDLEIWPANSPEEWIDEIGGHRFVGESLCAR